MRIISGYNKGKRIFSPSSYTIRPTSDRGREMIFNILSSIFSQGGISFSELNVLDCFCGTGSLGLESYSRGAKKVIFVDKNQESLNLTNKNIINLHVKSFCIEKIDLTQKFKKVKNIDLFFLDPPYGRNILNVSFKNLIESDWLNDKSYGVIESSLKEYFFLPDGWKILQQKTIRESVFYFLKTI